MGPILPVHARYVHQPQVDFVNQRGGLERVTRPFAAHVTPAQAVEFPVNQWGKLVQSGLVATAPSS